LLKLRIFTGGMSLLLSNQSTEHSISSITSVYNINKYAEQNRLNRMFYRREVLLCEAWVLSAAAAGVVEWCTFTVFHVAEAEFIVQYSRADTKFYLQLQRSRSQTKLHFILAFTCMCMDPSGMIQMYVLCFLLQA